MKNLMEFFGWYGMVAILAAYALVSFSIIGPNDIWYQTLNFTGAAGLVVISLRKRAYQPGVLNIFWAVIAAVAIWQIII